MNEEEGKFNIKKKWSKKKIAILSSISILMVIVLSLCTGYFYVRSKIYKQYTPPPVIKVEEEKKEVEVEYDVVDGVTNILLIGTDGRDLDENSRADSIIIATLDNNNKNVKLTSLFRDTLVNIPGHGEAKLNSAMELGGVELLIETIRNTYEIDLDKYVTINFWGFEAIIDQIGGLELDVKDFQLEEINKYIGESTGGNDCPITETGLQLLNGKQALSYARIRYNVGDDYARTERQREVVFKVAEKLKVTKPSKYLGIMNKMLDHIKTNIEPIQALNLAYSIYKLPSLEMQQLQMPLTDLSTTMYYKNLGSVFVMDRKQNTKILHEFIFENKQPDESTFDYYSLYSVIGKYEADHIAYENLYGPVKKEEDTPIKNEVTTTVPEVQEDESDKKEEVDLDKEENSTGSESGNGSENGTGSGQGSGEGSGTEPGGEGSGTETGGEGSETEPGGDDDGSSSNSNNGLNRNVIDKYSNIN